MKIDVAEDYSQELHNVCTMHSLVVEQNQPTTLVLVDGHLYPRSHGWQKKESYVQIIFPNAYHYRSTNEKTPLV